MVFALLSFLQGCHMRCCIATADTWAMGVSHVNGRRWCLDRALRYRGFLGEIGWEYSQWRKLSCRLISDCSLRKAEEQSHVPCTCALPFRNKPRYLEKFDKLSWLSLTWFFWISRNQRRTAQIVTSQTNKNILAVRYLSDIENLSLDSPRAGSRIDRQRWWLDW